ncbi:MAG: TVP38/TMEM64 family protein [Coriobacteriia bacterium]|nr:TVP38/TMEM64 family protein [Coriobacteriia bacterium]MBS5478218.1 TVP38/TMEM64 family protein [Coriobacteriia bacterium]
MSPAKKTKKLDLSKLSKRARIAIFVGVIVAVVALAVAITIAVMPYIRMLGDPETMAQFEAWVASLGPLGFLLLLGIQVAQIIIAFIPGEFVQVAAGVMYGTWAGLALCLLGCFIASAGVFIIVRKLGHEFVVKLFGQDKLDSFSFLNDSSKLETLVFILFLIPGMPKDVLTYIVPLTKIKLGTFMLLSTIARIPGMVASTLIGSSITDANWPLIIGIFAVVIVVGGLCIWKKDALMGWAKRCGGVKQEPCENEKDEPVR